MGGLGGGGLKILGLEGGSVPHYMPCVFFVFFFKKNKIFRFNKIHKKGIEKSLKKSKTTQDLALIGHHSETETLTLWGRNFMTKYGTSLLQNVSFLLQNAAFITKCVGTILLISFSISLISTILN